MLASTVNAILAQRLVRRLDPEQREAFEASASLIAEHRLDLYTDERPIKLYRPKANASGGGYNGRIAITELLVLSDKLREMVMDKVESSSLESAARKEGLRTLYEDGLRLALSGVTSLEEILRVTNDDGAHSS